jgi:hypothetical protein
MTGSLMSWHENWLPGGSGQILEIGALFFRTKMELILKNEHVIQGRLLDSGFSILNFLIWNSAASELCSRVPVQSR